MIFLKTGMEEIEKEPRKKEKKEFVRRSQRRILKVRCPIFKSLW